MDWLTTSYIILVIAGIVWVVYRFWRQVRAEREEESHPALSLSEEQFKAYLKSLKSEKP